MAENATYPGSGERGMIAAINTLIEGKRSATSDVDIGQPVAGDDILTDHRPPSVSAGHPACADKLCLIGVMGQLWGAEHLLCSAHPSSPSECVSHRDDNDAARQLADVSALMAADTAAREREAEEQARNRAFGQ
jgi:hypothetical protein